MITALLKRDPLIRAQPWVVLLVALMTAALGKLLLDVVELFEDVSSSSESTPFDTSGVSTLVTGFFAFQALLVSFSLCAAANKRRDGAPIFSRSRPLELFLPISPRDAWSARLLAHGVMIVMPLLAIILVLYFVQGRPHFSEVGIVGANALSVVLFCFARGPERAGLTRLRDHLGVTVTATALLVILLFDLGVFSAGDVSGPPLATAAVLLVAAVRAKATHRRLPKGWLLPDSAPQKGPEHEAAVAALAFPTSPRWRHWRVRAATVWTVPGMALCHMGLVVAPVLGAFCAPWVALLICAGLLVACAHHVLAHSKFLGALPVSRRSLLWVMLAPTVLSIGLGCLVAQGWNVWRHSERPEVTLEKQLLRQSSAGSGYDVWVDVVVPRYAWRFAAGGEIPEQVAPNGERVRPRGVSVLGLSFATVYNPYDAPFGASQEFTAWQFSRALEALQGVVIAADVLSERYLETGSSGEVRLNAKQVRRNLDRHEAMDGLLDAPYYGTMGTLVADYPQLAPRWDGRRAALPVLAVSALSALGCLLFLRLRAGSRSYRLVRGMMPASFGVLMAADILMETTLEHAHPQVLFALLGDAVLSWLPSSTVWLWAFTVAIAVSAVMVMARALDMAEAVTGQPQPPTRFTG